MKLKHFDTKPDLEKQLCQEIFAAISKGISERGKAFILLSGGSTPIGLYKLLALENIDWSKVKVGLVDERYVPVDSAYSNEKMIRDTLLPHNPNADTLISMIYDLNDYESNNALSNIHYRLFIDNPIDFCLLGMGGDGHTASLFPSDPCSEADLKNGSARIINTTASNEPRKRISCSKSLILSSNELALIICGENKLTRLQTAETEKLPISYFTNEAFFTCYYTPKS